MTLTLGELRVLADLVKEEVARKGTSFYGWVNAPEAHEDGRITHATGWGDACRASEVSAKRALEIYKGKLDGAYGERLVLAICAAVGAVKNGKKVALLQMQEEPGLPFDASGWLVLAIEGYPLFHLAPWDLPLAKANEAGLITFIAKGTREAREYAPKGTDKVQELGLLLDLMF